MNPTKPKYKYGDTVKNIDGTVAGSAVFDPDTGNPLTGAGAFNPNTGDAIKNVITPDLLKGTQPIPLPKENLTNPTADKVLSIADTAVEGAKTEAGTSQENYVKALQDVMNTTDKLGTYEEQAGAKQAEKTSRDLGNQVNSLVRNFSAFRQEVNNNPMIVGAVKDRRVSAEQTRVANTVADLQFTKSLVDQNLTDARKWAKDKIDLELRPLELEVENKKFVRDNAQSFFSTAQLKRLDAGIRKEEDIIAEERKQKEKLLNFKIELAKNQIPADLLGRVNASNDLNEIMTIPGVSKYLMSPIERLQQVKLSNDRKQNQDFNEALNDIASPGLTVKQRTELLKDSTAKQAVSRIGVIKAVQDYKTKADQYKSSGNFFRELTTKERVELDTMLNSTVGSAINVAQGQGAMGDEEAKRIMGDLKVKRIRGEKFVPAAADGVISSQKTLLDNDLLAIDSGIPGASDSFEVFAEYKKGNQTDDDFFSGNVSSTALSTDDYFNY